jgi:glycopeptide antibiotics resistance protein
MTSIRRWYLAAALAVTAFAFYGSLVPLHYRPVSWAEAANRFARIRYLALGVDSRADFVSNILLFVPLGFLFMGALRAERRGVAGTAVAAVAMASGCALLSVAIEFTQVFFPPRTVSINDIVAETAGALIGIAAWCVVGQALTRWALRFASERERPRRLVHVLAAYGVLFAGAQLLPLDLTISTGELARKYREGRILLMPFSHHWGSPILMLWDLGGDVALQIPLGVLAVIGWTRYGRRRASLEAFALGALFVCAIEAAQLLVYSRYADTTDLFTGSLGIALGIALAHRMSGRPAAVRTGGAGPATASLWFATVAWTGVLVAYHWYPFNFVLDREMIRQRLPVFLAAPFSSYYWGSEFHAFTELSRKLLMALPLGALLRVAWPLQESEGIRRLQMFLVFGATLALLFTIEAGQMLLPAHVADATDACVGEAGVVLGFWLVALVGSRQGQEATV